MDHAARVCEVDSAGQLSSHGQQIRTCQAALRTSPREKAATSEILTNCERHIAEQSAPRNLHDVRMSQDRSHPLLLIEHGLKRRPPIINPYLHMLARCRPGQKRGANMA